MRILTDIVRLNLIDSFMLEAIDADYNDIDRRLILNALLSVPTGTDLAIDLTDTPESIFDQSDIELAANWLDMAFGSTTFAQQSVDRPQKIR